MNARSNVRLFTVVAMLAGCSADAPHTASRSLPDDGVRPPAESSTANDSVSALPVATDDGTPNSAASERDDHTVRWQDGSTTADLVGGGPSSAGSEPPCGSDAPDRSYIGWSADECSRINFLCVEGTTMFTDECGCGCAAKN